MDRSQTIALHCYRRLMMDPLDNRGIGKSLLHRYCHREWKLLPSLSHIDPFRDLPSTPPHPPLLSPFSSSSFSIHPLLLSFFPNRLRSQDSFFFSSRLFPPLLAGFPISPFLLCSALISASLIVSHDSGIIGCSSGDCGGLQKWITIQDYMLGSFLSV